MASHARLGSLIMVLLLAMLGCAREAPFVSGHLAPGGEISSGPAILPAYQTAQELLVPGKADESSDYKAAHPELYAITDPPAVAGFRAMQEWEEMDGILLGFPDWTASYPNDEVVQTLRDIIIGSLGAGHVYIVYQSEAVKDTLLESLTVTEGINASYLADEITFVLEPIGGIWLIDYGPLPLVSPAGEVAFLDFRYYPYRHIDDAVPTRLGEDFFDVTTYRLPMFFEGGNFQADGEGTCYSTQRALDNTGFSLEVMEGVLADYAGCEELVILKDIHDDGTGHIDMFFKLCDTHTVVLGEYTVVDDPVAKADMDDNQLILESLSPPDGEAMAVYRMPFPHPGTYGLEKIPRTYINSTILNGRNLWPIYTVDKDIEADALAVWEEAMPTTQHVGIISDDISTLSGAVHCVTRTIPVGTYAPWIADGTCTAGTCDAPAGGYDGSCEDDGDCFGPAWVSDDNICDWECDHVPAAGCCTQTGFLRYCASSGTSATQDCGSPDSCGWYAGAGVYACGFEGEDPSGAAPRYCDDCQGDCTHKECGNDGCGTSCGECGDGMKCEDHVCVEDLCAGYPIIGCCDGDTLYWCDGDEILSKSCGDAPSCGWDAVGQVYGCDTDGEAAPEGGPTMACPCVPDCEGVECGDDGCGGECGTCPGDDVCVEGSCETPCQDACEEGTIGCSDGTTAWSCVLGEGTLPCMERLEMACPEGTTCQSGACKTPLVQDDTIAPGDASGGADAASEGDDEGDDDEGCSATPHGAPSSGSAALLVSFLVVMGLVVRRRRPRLDRARSR